jgi:hypothetical protein
MSNAHHSSLAILALFVGTLPAVAGDLSARVASDRNLVILKTRVVTPDVSPAFRLDDTLHTSSLKTGELFRQLLIDMPLAPHTAQASTARSATDGRGR